MDGYEQKDLRNLTAKLTLTPTENHDFSVETTRTEDSRQSLIGRSADSDDSFTLSLIHI